MAKQATFKLDTSAFLSSFGAVTDAVASDGGRKAVEAGAGAMKYLIRSTMPEGTTGRLAGSVKVYSAVPSDTGGGWQIRVGPTAVYAKMRNFGGTIKATNVGHLRFTSDGRARFPKVVHQRGSHYMEHAVAAAPGPVRDAMVASFNATIEEVTGG